MISQTTLKLTQKLKNLLHQNCLVNLSHILNTALIILPLCSSSFSKTANALPKNLEHVDREAALECQKNGFFVIVNFYPDQQALLTAGQEEEFIIVDEPVDIQISKSKKLEFYTAPNFGLQLPLALGADSNQSRKGIFTIKNPPLFKEDLNCLLHSAD